MAARASTVEDLESGKDQEFERIKQNFTTPPNHETLANLGEVQTAFQDLQSELQEYLAQYITKITSLREQITAGVIPNNGFDTQKTIVPISSPRVSQVSNGDSHQATDEDHPDHKPPRPSVINADKTLIDVHVRNLQAFLTMHTENIRHLQDSCHSPLSVAAKESQPASDNAILNDAQTKSWDTIAMANLNISVSTFTAILIVTFLLLVAAIIGSKHRTPYSVAMFFSFLALALLFIAIFTAKLLLQKYAPNKPDPEEFNFYLQICEQLQLVANILFIISLIIAMFFIFVSLAFPFVVLALSGICALVVFMCVHWEVAITFKNILYLSKNIRRLGTVVDFVKYNRKAPTPAGLYM